MLYFGGSNPNEYGVLIVQILEEIVAILIADRRVRKDLYLFNNIFVFILEKIKLPKISPKNFPKRSLQMQCFMVNSCACTYMNIIWPYQAGNHANPIKQAQYINNSSILKYTVVIYTNKLYMPNDYQFIILLLFSHILNLYHVLLNRH